MSFEEMQQEKVMSSLEEMQQRLGRAIQACENLGKGGPVANLPERAYKAR